MSALGQKLTLQQRGGSVSLVPEAELSTGMLATDVGISDKRTAAAEPGSLAPNSEAVTNQVNPV